MKYVIIGDIRNNNESVTFQYEGDIFDKGGRFDSLEDAIAALEIYKKAAPKRNFIINSDEILK